MSTKLGVCSTLILFLLFISFVVAKTTVYNESFYTEQSILLTDTDGGGLSYDNFITRDAVINFTTSSYYVDVSKLQSENCDINISFWDPTGYSRLRVDTISGTQSQTCIGGMLYEHPTTLDLSYWSEICIDVALPGDYTFTALQLSNGNISQGYDVLLKGDGDVNLLGAYASPFHQVNATAQIGRENYCFYVGNLSHNWGSFDITTVDTLMFYLDNPGNPNYIYWTNMTIVNPDTNSLPVFSVDYNSTGYCIDYNETLDIPIYIDATDNEGDTIYYATALYSNQYENVLIVDEDFDHDNGEKDYSFFYNYGYYSNLSDSQLIDTDALFFLWKSLGLYSDVTVSTIYKTDSLQGVFSSHGGESLFYEWGTNLINSTVISFDLETVGNGHDIILHTYSSSNALITDVRLQFLNSSYFSVYVDGGFQYNITNFTDSYINVMLTFADSGTLYGYFLESDTGIFDVYGFGNATFEDVSYLEILDNATFTDSRNGYVLDNLRITGYDYLVIPEWSSTKPTSITLSDNTFKKYVLYVTDEYHKPLNQWETYETTFYAPSSCLLFPTSPNYENLSISSKIIDVKSITDLLIGTELRNYYSTTIWGDNFGSVAKHIFWYAYLGSLIFNLAVVYVATRVLDLELSLIVVSFMFLFLAYALQWRTHMLGTGIMLALGLGLMFVRNTGGYRG